MKRFAFALLLIAAPALADAPPATVTLPSGMIVEMRRYLGTKPFDEVSRLVMTLEACVRAQAPGASPELAAQCPGLSDVPKKAHEPAGVAPP